MKKRIVALTLSLLMLLSMAPAAWADVIEVTIPHYKSGENVGAIFFLPQVERFNAKYEGQYKLNIEELTQDLYAEKMQQLAIQNKLPALVEGGTAEWLSDVVVPNGLFLDLTEFLKANPEVDEQIPDFQRAYNTTEDGKFVSVSYNVVRPIGLYYNSALTSFTKEPGEYASWDEMLADFGENKIALMTGENAWTTSLILSSLIAKEEGGVELLEAHTPVDNRLADYNHPAIVAAVGKLKDLYAKYGSSNTVGAVYADAANNFMSGNSAIIPNGSWMVSDFAPDAKDKWSNDFDGSTIVGAVFPGNVAIASLTGSYGWWIPATASEDERKLAEAFLSFILSKEEVEAYCLAEGGSPLNWNLSEETYAKLAETSPLMSSYTKAVNSDTIYCPNILDVMPSSVANTGFGSLLPQLFDGTYTPEQFCQQLTNMATEALAD
jgi:raffinose/stachyose/melibiose transport system substrate-binding protein